MVLYYSTSGNTAYVAKTIAEVFGEEAIDLKEMMAKGEKTFRSESLFIICAPVYYMNTPKELEEYLKECNFVGTESASLVLTASYSAGNAKKTCASILRSKGLKVLCTVFYPPTSKIVGLTYPSKASADKTQEKMRGEVVHYAEMLKSTQPVLTVGSSFFGLIGTAVGSLLREKRSDKKFFADDKCVSCCKCAEVCHRHNIVMKDGKPTFNGNCDHCSACINLCPESALQYGTRTEKRERRNLTFKSSPDDVFGELNEDEADS